MKKLIACFIAVLMVVAAPMAFADIDDVIGSASESNSQGGNASSGSSSSAAQQQGQGQAQGQGQMQGQGQIAAQGQGQLGIVSPSQSSTTNVGGDTVKNTMYYMSAPNTVAAPGQNASSVYSILGGVNLAQTAEYQVCREKIDVATLMAKNEYLTAEEAKKEAREAYAQLKKSTQRKRVLGIFNETDGMHIWNGFGMLSVDACPINVDTVYGAVTSIKMPAKKAAAPVVAETKVDNTVKSEPVTNFTSK